MVKIIVSRQVPKHWLPLDENVISEKKIVGLLALFVKEGIIVIAFEAFDHVARMAVPLVGLSVRLHRID